MEKARFNTQKAPGKSTGANVVLEEEITSGSEISRGASGNCGDTNIAGTSGVKVSNN